MNSTEISNLASAQLAQFSQAGAFAQQISALNGIQPSMMAGALGGSSAMDPRGSLGMLEAGGQLGAGLAGASVTAANVGLGAASLAADFGMLPAVMSPFRGTLGAASLGWSSAGGSSNMGMAAARGVGMGGLALGGYLAAGAAVNFLGDQLMQGVREQMEINSMVSLYGTRRQLPGMGGMTPSMAAPMGGLIRGMAGQDPMTSVSELTGVVGQGLQGGLFRDVTDLSQLQGRVRELKDALRSLADVMGTSLQGAMPVIQQMQSMGFYGVGQAASAGIAVAGFAGAAGLPTSSILNAGLYGSSMAGSFGMPVAQGSSMAMSLAGRLGGAQLMGRISEGQLRDLAGGAPLEQAVPMLSGQLSGAAMQAALANRQVMAALIDPDTGHIDASLASSFAAGGISSKELKKMSRANLRHRSVKEAMMARSSSLASELLDVAGPEGVLGGFARSELMSRGVKPGESGEDVMDTLLQKYSGLGEQQANIVQQLIASGPAIKAEVTQRLQQELSSSLSATRFQQNYSLEAIKRKMVDKLLNNSVVSGIRDLGAGMVNWGQEALTGAVDWFFGGGGGGGGPAQVTPQAANAYVRSLQGESYSVPGMGGGGGGSWTFGEARQGGPAGHLLSFVPGGDNGYSPQMSGLVAGGAVAGWGAGKLLGPGMRMLGRTFNLPAALGAGGSASMGGIAAKMAGRAAGGLGMSALGLLGRVAGPVGAALSMYDLFANQIPAVRVGLGLDMDTSNGISDPEVGRMLYREHLAGGFQGQDTYESRGLDAFGDYGAPERYGAFGGSGYYGKGGWAGIETGVKGLAFYLGREDMAQKQERLYQGLLNPTAFLEKQGFGRDDIEKLRSVYHTNQGRVGVASYAAGGAPSAEADALARAGGNFGNLRGQDRLIAMVAAGATSTKDLNFLMAGGRQVFDLTDVESVRKLTTASMTAALAGGQVSSEGSKSWVRDPMIPGGSQSGSARPWRQVDIPAGLVAGPAPTEDQVKELEGSLRSEVGGDTPFGKALMGFSKQWNAPLRATSWWSDSQDDAIAGLRQAYEPLRRAGKGSPLWNQVIQGGRYSSFRALATGVIGPMAEGVIGARASAQEALNAEYAGVGRVFSGVNMTRLGAVLGGGAAETLRKMRLGEHAALQRHAGVFGTELAEGAAKEAGQWQEAMAKTILGYSPGEQAAAIGMMGDDPRTQAMMGRSVATYGTLMGGKRSQGLSAVLASMDPTGELISRDFTKSLSNSIEVHGRLRASQMADVEKVIEMSGVSRTSEAFREIRGDIEALAGAKTKKDREAASTELAADLGRSGANFRPSGKASQGDAMVDKLEAALNRFVDRLEKALPKT